MKKKDWKEELNYLVNKKKFHDLKEVYVDIEKFVQQEIDKAREEQFTEEELKLLSDWGSALWSESNAFTLIVGDVNFGNSGKNIDLINKIDKLTK